jgi:hypothetical protein
MKQLLGILFATVVVGCVPMTTSMTTSPDVVMAAHAGTGVYVNGSEISEDDKYQLEQLLGEAVPPGAYYIAANGDAGVVGQPPSVNLVELQRQRQAATGAAAGGQDQTAIYSRDSGGYQSSMVSEGDCILVTTPGVDFASSGC